MNDFSIMVPCGQIRILMSIGRMTEHIARQVMQGSNPLQTAHIPFSASGLVSGAGLVPQTATMERKIHKLLPVYEDGAIGRLRQLNMQNPSTFREHHEDVLKSFLAERFKHLVTKKEVEFYVPDLDLEQVEKLACKYLENFGSDQVVMVIFKLSQYHQFAAIVDTEKAFRIYMNEDYMAELVELDPSKWILGRYGNDLTMLKQMEGMRRYDLGYYLGSKE